ncbi:MAG: site-specific integrase [Peptococcaceae bacterium]|nr:site-specific integrase [Peptococcaceae bacterium]
MAQVRRRGKNKYTISVYLGRDAQGKRRYHYETFYGTLTQARHRAAELEVQLKRKTGPRNAAMKLSEYLQMWLARIKDTVAERTWDTYSWHVRKLTECAGHLQLYNISAMELQDALGNLQHLSPKSVRGICATLRTALRQAVSWGLLATDPTMGIKTPRVEPKKRKILTKEEHQRLLEATRHFKHGLVIYLLAETGMRLGEVLGLTWQDVSFERKTITISRAADVRHRKLNTEPKNVHSIRTIQINDKMVALLKEHKRKQENAKVTPFNRADDLVFKSDDGRVLKEQSVRRTLKKALKKAGIQDHMRIHDLRHSAGSLLLEAGYSLASVAEFLGHSNTSTTSSIYAHAVRRAGCVSDACAPITDKPADRAQESQ